MVAGEKSVMVCRQGSVVARGEESKNKAVRVVTSSAWA